MSENLTIKDLREALDRLDPHVPLSRWEKTQRPSDMKRLLAATRAYLAFLENPVVVLRSLPETREVEAWKVWETGQTIIDPPLAAGRYLVYGPLGDTDE